MVEAILFFSDEKKFNMNGPDGYQFYWHDLKLEKETFLSRNHGAGSVMIWGGISSEGSTELPFLDGIQSSADYIKVLEDHLLPFGVAHYEKIFIFQQHNAPIHASILTWTFFQSRNLNVMSWPACFPDLNLLEIVCQDWFTAMEGSSKSDLVNAGKCLESNGWRIRKKP